MGNNDPEPQPWLRTVELHQYSELIERERSPRASAGHCGALPARGLAVYHPLGCMRQATHQGPHSADAAAAEQMDRRDAVQVQRR